MIEYCIKGFFFTLQGQFLFLIKQIFLYKEINIKPLFSVGPKLKSFNQRFSLINYPRVWKPWHKAGLTRSPDKHSASVRFSTVNKPVASPCVPKQSETQSINSPTREQMLSTRLTLQPYWASQFIKWLVPAHRCRDKNVTSLEFWVQNKDWTFFFLMKE